VVWGESNLEILVHEPIPDGKREFIYPWGWPREEPHWNWEGAAGDSLDVNVYTSYPLVRLYLNGELLGEKEIDPRKGITAGFRVAYRPGELKAIATNRDGNQETRSLYTSGPTSGLVLKAEQTTIMASHQAIVFVNISAIDHENRPVPTAALPIRISVEGQGKLLAAGNGSPLLEGSIQDHEFNLFRGKGLIIIRSTGEPGNIRLSVRSEDGLSDQINMKAVE
jgi:beta-galactosidase